MALWGDLRRNLQGGDTHHSLHVAPLPCAGHVVLCSIHQPRAAIWSMFHRVGGAHPREHGRPACSICRLKPASSTLSPTQRAPRLRKGSQRGGAVPLPSPTPLSLHKLTRLTTRKHRRPCWQVTLLALGRLVFHGHCGAMVDWLSGGAGLGR